MSHATSGGRGTPVRIRLARHAAAAAGALLLAACDLPTGTDPGEQPGFGQGSRMRYGAATLIVSSQVATGRTVDPIVLAEAASPAEARAAGRFRSTHPAVMDVAKDGKLLARLPGETIVIVDLDGAYDSVNVEVVPGLAATAYEVADDFKLRAFNARGDLAGIRGEGSTLHGILIRDGIEDTLPGCVPNDISAFGLVLCEGSSELSKPGVDRSKWHVGVVYLDGVMAQVIPDSMGAGTVVGINDRGEAFGQITNSKVLVYYMGEPGSLAYHGFYGVPYAEPYWSTAGFGVVYRSGNSGENGAYYRVHGAAYNGFAGTQPLFMNERGDILGSNGVAWWAETTSTWPGGTLPGTVLTGHPRCPPRALSDSRAILGVGEDGPCRTSMQGEYTVVEQAMATDAIQGWQVDWRGELSSPVIQPPMFHSSGTLALNGRSASGKRAVILVRSE